MKKVTFFSRFFRETRFTWVMSCLTIALSTIQSVSAATYTISASGQTLTTTTSWTPAATLPATFPPSAGDANIWSNGVFIVKIGTANNTSSTFFGETLSITGGTITTAFQGPTLLLNNILLNGGKIITANGNPFVLDLSQNGGTNHTFTLTSGYLGTGQTLTAANLLFKNANLAGAGNITIAPTAAGTNANYVEFQSTVNTTGFTGTFTVAPGFSGSGVGGTLKISAPTSSGTYGVYVPAASASPGVTLNGVTYTSSVPGQLWFNPGAGNILTLVSLTLGATNIAPGTYTLAQLTSYSSTNSHLAYLNQSSTGTVTVTGPVPTAVVATPGNQSASVAFTAPLNNGGSTITGYTVTAHDVLANSDVATQGGTSSPITVSGLTNNRSYTFTVTATNGVGTSAASTASAAVTPIVLPNAPTNVVGTPYDAYASVAFTASVANGSTIDHYSVTPYVGAVAGTPVTGSSSPIVVTGLNNGVEYTFQVVAVDLVAGASTVATSGTVIPAGVQSYWDGTTATGFGSQLTNAGESEANPIFIRTPMQWMYAANLAAGDANRGKKFKLIENLNFKNLANAKTFGPLTAGAVFDGDGHTVTNIILNSTSAAQALFSTVTSATVKNLGLTGAGSITGLQNTAGIATSAPSSTISNCYNTTPISGDIVSAQSANTKAMTIAGIVGSCNGTTIQGCYNSGTITGVARVAGIAGANATNATTISNCYNTGVINAVYRSGASNFGDTGGIVGYIATTTSPTTIESCYNTGNVTVVGGGSGNQQVGGIVGNGVSASISINNCFNTGTVSLDNTLTTINTAAAGGISACNAAVITNCYNAGTVQFTGGIVNTNIGGIIGLYANKDVPSNCYTLTGSGYNDLSATTSRIKTVTELQTAGFYSTLNNGQTKWMDNPNTGYPVHVYKTLAMPDAPGAIAATPSSGQVSVAFTAPIYTGSSAISNYTVTTYNGITQVGSPATSSSSPIVVSGLSNGTNYTFTVKANNSTVSSVPGTAAVAACVVPDAPTIGTATASASVSGQATVTFTASGNNGGSVITGYTATSSPDSKSGYSTTAGTITVNGLTGGTAYTFTVVANNAAGASATSGTSNSITTVPGAPTIGAASATGVTGTARVAFTAPAGNTGTAITSYTATSSPAGGTGALSQAGSGTIIVSGLTDGTPYTFTVTATNATGTGSASAASTSVTTSVFTVPDAPTGVSAAVAGVSGQATVSFTAPVSNGGSAITSYTATSTPGIKTGTLTQAGSGTITVTGLTNGTAYTFTVVANNLAGASAASTPASNSVTPYTNPGAPTIGTATAGNGQASVAFTAPASNGGLPITNYTATSIPGSFTGTVNQAGSGTITVTGLANGTAYTFTVIATNSGGATSAASGVSGEVTPDATSHIISVGADLNTSDLTLTPVSDISVASGYTLTVNGTPKVNSITVTPGGKLTLTPGNTLSVTAALTLQSSSSGTATFVDENTNNSLTVTGTTSVQQYLTTGRNWYISSPVSGANSSVFNAAAASNINKLYKYDETQGSSLTLNWPQITDNVTSLAVGKGYVANVDASLLAATNGVTFSEGTLNSGDITTGVNGVPALSYTSDQYKSGFNLVGNPYCSYLNWNTVTKTNLASQTMWYRTKVDATYYFYTYNSVDGAAGVGISIPADVTSYIPPMQAFWVRAAASGSLTFHNTDRAHKDVSNNILRSKAQNNSTLQLARLQVTNGVNSDETVLYTYTNASNQYDSYDSPKMSNGNASIPEIYTVADAENLAINGMNSIPYDTEIPLGFTTGQAGSNFSIKASQFSNFSSGTQLILKDYQDINNPAITDLSNGSSYTFSSNVTTNNISRFAVVFKAPSITTGINPNSNNDVWISTNGNSQIIVNGANSETTVSVYNAVGQKLASQTMNSTTSVLNNTFAPGVYMVSVTNSGKTLTKKIIVE